MFTPQAEALGGTLPIMTYIYIAHGSYLTRAPSAHSMTAVNFGSPLALLVSCVVLYFVPCVSVGTEISFPCYLFGWYRAIEPCESERILGL